jgi:hypothetical protein
MSNEENSSETSSRVFWRNLAVEYWYYVVIFGLILIGAIILFLITLDRYIATSTIGGQGTWTFDEFSMGTAVEFGIFLLLWILIIAVVPALVVAGILVAILWTVVFTSELKEDIKLQFKKDEERQKKYRRRSEEGGIFGFLMFLGVCIYIIFDDHWMTEFGNLGFKYFVDAWIAVFLWVLVLCGIGGGLGIIWFINKYGPNAS